ncbi:hypothetical protein ACWC9X_12690 [Streptomyces asoensis]
MDAYLRAALAAAPTESLDWEGHLPGDGAVYKHTYHHFDIPNAVTRNQWLTDLPPAAPTALAQQAVDTMKLAGLDVASLSAARR